MLWHRKPNKNIENKQDNKDSKDNNFDSVYLQHTKKYTDLLGVFVDSTRSSNRLKHWLKLSFFIIIVLIMGALVLLFAYSVDSAFKIIELSFLNTESSESIVGAVVSIIPSFATMLVSLVKLPKIIAKYLFNPKEDKNMTKIIGQIQDYDLKMYPMEQRVKSLREEQQDVSLNDFDGILQSLLSNNAEKPKSINTKNDESPNNDTNSSSTSDDNAG